MIQNEIKFTLLSESSIPMWDKFCHMLLLANWSDVSWIWNNLVWLEGREFRSLQDLSLDLIPLCCVTLTHILVWFLKSSMVDYQLLFLFSITVILVSFCGEFIFKFSFHNSRFLESKLVIPSLISRKHKQFAIAVKAWRTWLFICFLTMRI